MGIKLKKYRIFLISIVFLTLIIVLYIFKIDICVSKLVFGVPCPGCGMTRAYVSLLKLNIHDAFFYHPLFFLISIILIVITRHKKINFSQQRIFLYSIVAMFIIVWVIRMFMYFPNVEPMKYNKKSLLYIVVSTLDHKY